MTAPERLIICLADVAGSDVFYTLFIMFEKYEVEHLTENLVYDLATFLSASGGNLGLLMGFSCLSVLSITIEFAANKLMLVQSVANLINNLCS